MTEPTVPQASELGAQAIELLKRLRDGAIPAEDIEPTLAQSVWLPRFTQLRLVKSPKEWHFGAEIPHMQITDRGRAELRRLETGQ